MLKDRVFGIYIVEYYYRFFLNNGAFMNPLQLKNKIFLGIFSVFLSLPVFAADCTNCGKQNKFIKAPDPAVSGDGKRWFKEFNARVHDTTLDNPEDSTTLRASYLSFESPISHYERTVQVSVYNLLIDLIKTDHYAQVTLAAVTDLGGKVLPVDTIYNALAYAINDPCILVSVVAAGKLLSLSALEKMPYNPTAEKILRDATVGRNRTRWNVSGLRGLYPKEDYDKDPKGTIENVRDMVQATAFSWLDAYYNQKEHPANNKRANDKALFYLDSVKFHDSSEEVRKSAKNVQRYNSR